MPYPIVSDDQIGFFREHGWLVVEDALALREIDEVARRMQVILDKKEKLAFDWAWEKGTPREAREFRIVQASPTRHWPEFNDARFRHWAIAFGSTLMGQPLEFWYDQFLAKPPGRSAPTLWHQDEGYW